VSGTGRRGSGGAGRILLTGGAGFIGSHLLDALIGRGFAVTVLDDFDDFYDPTEKRRNLAQWQGNPAVIVVEGDVRDAAVWGSLGGPGAGASAGADGREWQAVIHLAARAGVRPSLRDPGLYVSTNVDGTLRVLSWAASRTRPVPVLLASSSSVYGDENPVPFQEDARLAPVSPYGATKAAAEALLESWHQSFGLRVVALRFFTVYGPRQRPDLAIRKFARRMLAGEPIPLFGDGGSARDYTHVSDVVRGTLAALEGLLAGTLPHRVYNLGSDRALTLDALVAALEEATGARARIERQRAFAGDVRRTWADLGRSRRELGYEPAVDFADGLRDFVAWLRAKG
jgi:UDP-glucuronate 4-epimerase